MKYEVAKPNTKLTMALEMKNKRKLARMGLDIEEKHGASLSMAYLINYALDAMDAKALVEKFGGGK